MRQIIIGLSGYARSGKDTVADILVARGDWQRISFAAKLKEAVYVLNPYIMPNDADTNTPENPYRLQELIDALTPDTVKDQYPEYRRLLQVMGTEVGRNLFGENFWVDIAFKTADPNKNIVITDCRFPNEASGVKELGGEVWRITRDGTGPVNGHPSETSLDDWPFDATFFNNDTIEVLAESINAVLDDGVYDDYR